MPELIVPTSFLNCENTCFIFFIFTYALLFSINHLKIINGAGRAKAPQRSIRRANREEPRHDNPTNRCIRDHRGCIAPSPQVERHPGIETALGVQDHCQEDGGHADYHRVSDPESAEVLVGMAKNKTSRALRLYTCPSAVGQGSRNNILSN